MKPIFNQSLLSFFILSILLTGCWADDNNNQSKDTIGLITNEFADDFLAQIHTHKDIKDSKWLENQLKTENNKHLECLFNAFASIKDSVSFYPIKDRITKEDIDDDLFVVGMNALGLLGPKDSVGALIKMLYPDIDTKRSESILVAIGNIGSDEGFEFSAEPKAIARNDGGRLPWILKRE